MNNEYVLDPGKWVDRYADVLYGYILVRVGDTGMAEDIVQEIFLSAWKSKESYKGDASEKNWLYAICRHKIIDHFRRNARQQQTVEAGSISDYFDQADHWTAETKPKEWQIDYRQPLDKKEFHAALLKCKQKLKQLQQSVFSMKYMEDIDSEEICKILGISNVNYWVLIHRAKLQLRSCLEKNWMNIK